MSGSDREALPEDWDWSGGSSGGLGVFGSPSRWFGSGRESLPEVREWSGMVWRPPVGLGVVGRHSRRSGSGQEALPDVRE